MKRHQTTKHDEHFDLALGATAIGVGLFAAVIGAFLPLLAALVIGGIAAWIGEHLDRHLISPLPTWRVLGLAGLAGAAIGWLISLGVHGRHHGAEWPLLSSLAVALAGAILAIGCRRRP